MPSYGYVAIDKLGKEKKGSAEAENEAALTAQLKSQGLIVVEIKKQNLMTKDIDLGFLDKVKPRDLAIFCRQLVSMLHAGVAVIDALEMLEASTESKPLKRAIGETRRDVEKGESLSDAMSMHPVFPNMLIHMVQAGEASGTLETSFDRMATQFEKDARLNGLISKALVYPTVVIIVAIAVIIVLLATVIPSFMGMFAELDVELPALTKMVIAMSNFVKSKWFVLIAVIVAVVAAFYYFKKTKFGADFLSKAALFIPALKSFTVKTSSSRLARTLSTLLAAGVPMVEALEITQKTMTNTLFKQALEDAKDDVLRGIPLSRPLEECGLFPPMVYYMVRIGEETGDMEEMLGKMADYYDEEVEIATQSLLAALEPAIIVVLAVFVGFVIGGALGPMVSLYNNLDKL